MAKRTKRPSWAKTNTPWEQKVDIWGRMALGESNSQVQIRLETQGIYLDRDTIRKVREELEQLSEELAKKLPEEVQAFWRDRRGIQEQAAEPPTIAEWKAWDEETSRSAPSHSSQPDRKGDTPIAPDSVTESLTREHFSELIEAGLRLRDGLEDDPLDEFFSTFDPEYEVYPDDPDLYDEFTDWDKIAAYERERDKRPAGCGHPQFVFVKDHLRGTPAGKALDRALNAWPTARQLWHQLEEPGHERERLAFQVASLGFPVGYDATRGVDYDVTREEVSGLPRITCLLDSVRDYRREVTAFKAALTPDARLRKLIWQGHCDLCP